MTVSRSVLVAALIFAFMFDLALQGFSQRQCQRDLLLLERDLLDLKRAKDSAQDSFDAALYSSLFQPDRTIVAHQEPELDSSPVFALLENGEAAREGL